MRTQTDTHRVVFRKVYEHTNLNAVFAMALTPDDQTLAIFGQPYDPITDDRVSAFNVLVFIRASDGGYIQIPQHFRVGNDNWGIARVSDRSLAFSASGSTLYMAFENIANKQQASDNGIIKTYSKRMVVGALDVASNGFNWVNEQALHFGHASSVVYHEFCAGCANIIVGGNNDWSHVEKQNDPEVWELALVFLKEDGTAPPNSVFLIDQSAHSDETTAPTIDHMHLDAGIGAPG